MTTGDQALNRLLRALGDTTRRNIITELGRRDRQSLFELYTRVVAKYGIGQTRQGFSRHLIALEEAGLIEIEWQGTTKLHRLNTAPILQLRSGWLKSFEEERQ